MPSYGYGISKQIESTQGRMSVADITTGRMFVNTPSNEVFTFPEVSYFIENGFIEYAYNNSNLSKKPPKKMYKIATIGATSIYCILYVSNPDILPTNIITPSMGDNVRLWLFCADENGEQTIENPNGYRIGVTYSFPLWDRIEQHTFITADGIDEVIERHTYKTSNYGFFSTVDGGKNLYFESAPLNVEPRRVDIELSSFNVIYDLYFDTASALTTGLEYIGVGSFELFNLNGSNIEIEILEDSIEESNTGGGGGSYDLYSDNIDFPSLPTLGAANSGLLTLYNPTIEQLRNLSNWLWGDTLLQKLETMFAQPMDLIVTLNIIPTEPNQLGNIQEVKIGGVDTGIDMVKVNNQYAIIDCGILNVKEFYGSALDYGTYTKASLYLPFCNVVQLKIDEVMNAQIHVRYHADLFSGSCVAFVKIIRQGLNSVLYSFEGNLGVSLPLISRDFTNLYQSIVKSSTNMLSSGLSLTSALDSAINVMGSKPNINRTGGISSTGGLLGIKKPYLIIERPIQSLASGYNKFVGYPSNVTRYLYTLKGYTEIDEVITNNLNCSINEQNEIIEILKSGVYL